jgi:ABC-type transport system involved in multi-copper enzyme maturation permease subunit
MRAYELIKETFFRGSYIWIVHAAWLTIYGVYWWLFLPEQPEYGRFVFIWGGFLLPLALSAGIFGDDIASGRICVLVTKPFWWGEIYIYRLLGLSLQGALNLILAVVLAIILHAITRKGSVEGAGPWLLATWLLFNACAALSTSLSVVIRRTYNALLLLVVIVAGYFVVSMLVGYMGQQQGSKGLFMGFVRYLWPPFELLYKFAYGEYEKYSFAVGKYSVPKSIACIVHSLMLTLAYSVVGIVLLTRRQFSRERD